MSLDFVDHWQSAYASRAANYPTAPSGFADRPMALDTEMLNDGAKPENVVTMTPEDQAMNIRFLTKTVAVLVVGLVATTQVTAEEKATDSDCTMSKQALTVFQDVRAMNRRKGAGQNLTELHQKYEIEGWDFDDLEIYIEDGDLEGFFVTYSRKHCKPEKPESGSSKKKKK
jgi:hypothetical protein